MSTQTRLSTFGSNYDPDLSELTSAERKAYVAIRINGVGVREFARATDRAPGTVGNLLQRADRKLGE